MQAATGNLTILGALLQAFDSSPTSKQFPKLCEEKLTLFVIERQDKNLAYVTDGFHTILALSSKFKDELSIHPANLLCNRFYIFQEKTYLFLNFTETTLAPEPHLLHPYTPHYYFRQRFNQFIQVRQTLKMPNPCEQLILTKWQLALVNVNAEGYYAPAIIMHEYRKSWSQSPPIYQKLNCILYQNIVQRVLEKYRLNDLREYHSKKIPKRFQVSLFYFARNKIVAPLKGEGSLIVSIDKDKQILNYSQNRRNHIILASNQLDGLCSFIDAKRNQVTQEDSLNIQKRNLVELFNGLDLNQKKENLEEEEKEKAKKGGKNLQLDRSLWHDTSSEESESEGNEKMDVEFTENEEQSSEDEEDPLKNLYMKLIEKEFK